MAQNSSSHKGLVFISIVVILFPMLVTAVIVTVVNMNMSKDSGNTYLLSNVEALAGGEGGGVIEIKCCAGLFGSCSIDPNKKGPEITCKAE